MSKNIGLFFILTFTLVIQSCAQSTTPYRNKNWSPKTGKYFFSTVLSWSFENELTTEDHLKKGEISVYVDEKSGTFLLTREAYGWSGEMVDFVIADQKGNYIMGLTDEHGGKHWQTIKSEQYPEILAQTKQILADFNTNCTPTGKTKIFGTNTYGWPTKAGKEYALAYQKTEDKSILYLGTTNYSFLPMFLFNKLELEAKLPISFDYSLVLPANSFPLEDTYEWNGNKVKTTFLSASPTEYFIDLNEYKKL